MDNHIHKLNFADSSIVADINNVNLSGTNPPRAGGGQGASFQQRAFGGGGQNFGGGGGQQPGSVQSTDPFAKVVANQRTNSLIITATKERLARIEELIKELDVEVKTETTTFVVPLRNAQ